MRAFGRYIAASFILHECCFFYVLIVSGVLFVWLKFGRVLILVLVVMGVMGVMGVIGDVLIFVSVCDASGMWGKIEVCWECSYWLGF